MKLTDKEKSMIEDLKDACYVGEDGAMATQCKTKRGAWIKFRKQVREDCGEYEASEIKLDDIIKAWAHVATKEEFEEWGGECEWFVNFGEKKEGVRNFPVWYYEV